MSAALRLLGAPGAGKSAVLGALTTELELAGVAYGALETDDDLVAVRHAIGVDTTLVVLLGIDPGTAAARIAAREPERWPGKAGLIVHGRALADSVEALTGVDARIGTGGRDAVGAPRPTRRRRETAVSRAAPGRPGPRVGRHECSGRTHLSRSPT